MLLTRTTHTTPKRTTKLELTSKTESSPDIIPTTIKLIEENRRRQEELKKISDKESSYNMMFYNDDDSMSVKKEEQEVIDSEYDKKGLKEDSVSANSITDTNEESETTSESVKDGEIDRNDLAIFNITTTIKSALEEKLRDKRRPTCSMIKLRQLNFNSPRTLPEVRISVFLF